MMRKLLMLTLLASAVAAIVVTQGTAKPPGANGLISFTRFDPALEQDVVYTVNPDGSRREPSRASGRRTARGSPS